MKEVDKLGGVIEEMSCEFELTHLGNDGTPPCIDQLVAAEGRRLPHGHG
jgi:hypothetical protein